MCANVYGGKHLETKVASKVRADRVGASLVEVRAEYSLHQRNCTGVCPGTLYHHVPGRVYQLVKTSFVRSQCLSDVHRQ